MKALITGGAGFIGFHLAKHLSSKGIKVTIADNFQRGRQDNDFKSLLKQKNVSLLQVDITKEDQLAKLKSGYDFVYHFAAINGTGNFYRIPDQVLKVGAVGTINLLEWFSKKNSKGKIIFSSSSETYGGLLGILGSKFKIPTPENVPLVVSDPKNLRWSYGASKILGEVAFFSYAKARKFKRFAIIRYHNIYGPRMGYEHVIPQFIERIAKKENPFRIFGKDQTRSFCFVDDAVQATQLVMKNEKTNGEIIHIGRDDSEIKIIDVAEKLFKIANFHPKLKVEKEALGTVKRRCPDISKLKKLGFRPKISLDKGLRKTYDWYKV
ncbi:epimerase [Candidatus Woesearchaeota archaeon]|jgi:nucleoside-diphosphate-sugar epimerase|nr:epimerase [Candidatus Woesearchaeota archaeon]MDP6647826.1 SDR family NAD(P)-dependent oxidoreductase [Candidatus Woesearchaeota archaeon]|tara:strand:+ start:534 stop:1502 length:969 start_codon:yes stop_codon:yes gene_type:complete